MPGSDCDPWFHLTPTCLPTCLPHPPLKCLCSAPCLFLKCQDGFRHHFSLSKRLLLIPSSLHLPLYLQSVCCKPTSTQSHTNTLHSLSEFTALTPVHGGFTMLLYDLNLYLNFIFDRTLTLILKTSVLIKINHVGTFSPFAFIYSFIFK